MPVRKCSNVTGEQAVLQSFGWLIGAVSLILASTAYQNDLDWNEIVHGNAQLNLKGGGKIQLNLTLPYQHAFSRPTSKTSRTFMFLISLSVLLLLSIAIYTFLSIRGTQIRPTCVTFLGMTFHGFATISLAFLSYSQLMAKSDVTTQEREICIGYNKELFPVNSHNEIAEFIQKAFCVCSVMKRNTIFRNISYEYRSLEDLTICQNVMLKQIAGIILLLYVMITLVISCTQFKDLMIMSSAVTISPAVPNRPVVVVLKSSKVASECNNNINNNTADIKIDIIENNNEIDSYAFQQTAENETAEDMNPSAPTDFPEINIEQPIKRKVYPCGSDISVLTECVCSNINVSSNNNNNLEDEDFANGNVKNKEICIKPIHSYSTVASQDAINSFW